MAGQDELIYRIKFEVDDTSLKSVQEQVNAVQAEMAQAPAASPIKQIQIDSKQSLQSLVELQKQINSYRGELKSLQAEQKRSGQTTDEQLRREQELKVSIKATSQEYNRATQSLASQASANSAAATTYNELVARNKALSAELRNLPLDDTTGKLAELQSEYARNNERLKEFDRTLGNHQRNVGNYERALQGVTIGTQKLGGSIKGVGFNAASFGIQAMTSSARAFQPAADLISDGFTRIGQTVTTVLQRIKGLTGAFQALKDLRFRDALDLVVDGMRDIFTEVRSTDDALKSFLDTQKAIEVTENQLIVTRAKANAELADAKLIAMDANVPLQDRISALNRVVAEEERVADLEIANARRRAETLEAIAALDVDSREKAKQAAEARAQVYQLEEQSINRQREAQEKLNTLNGESQALEDQVRADRIAGYEALADSAISIGTSLFGETKAMKVAEAIMDTYRGATSAFADTPGGIFIKSAAAAAAVVAGLANVKKILSTKPGSKPTGGGVVKAQAPSLSMATTSLSAGGAEAVSSIGVPGLSTERATATLQTAALDAFASRGAPSFKVEANIDRRGIAIAVRDGERQIRNDSIAYQ